MDYFDYFGIKPGFQLDLNELRKKYYEKSKLLHPDIQKSGNDDSIFLSAYNNQAYQTLLDPLSRLKYIIETLHGPIQENHALLSQDFLMEMMDLHEQVNDALNHTDLNLLEKLRMDLSNFENNAFNDSQSAIKDFDRGERDESVFNKLTIYYFKLKYFKRLKQALENGSVEI